MRKQIIILLLSLTALMSVQSAIAQNITGNLSYGAGYEYGKLIPGDKFGKDLIRTNGFRSYNPSVTYRADSLTATPYDLTFGHPGLETGIILADYTGSSLGRPKRDYTSSIGYIIGLYGKFNRDLLNTGVFRLGYSISNGIGYCTRPYSVTTNIDNEFIGSRFSIYFSTGLYAACRFHPNFEVMAEAGLRHFSNSALGRPHKGANTVGITVGLTYYPAALEIPSYRPCHRTTVPKGFWFDISAGCNLHTMIETWYLHQSNPTGVPARFPVRPSFASSLAAMYRYHLKFSSGISLDYMYAGY